MRHLKVLGLAALFGLGAYAVIRGLMALFRAFGSSAI